MIYAGQRAAVGLTSQMGGKWGRDSRGGYSRGG